MGLSMDSSLMSPVDGVEYYTTNCQKPKLWTQAGFRSKALAPVS